jgi:hypothetical protein
MISQGPILNGETPDRSSRDQPVARKPSEVTEAHTHLLRLMLSVSDCESYFESVDPTLTGEARVQAAFEGRWFGPKSLPRVRTLLANMALRFDRFPDALFVLRSYRVPPSWRALACHWHLQLADPVYRAFTGSFLPDRVEAGLHTVDRGTVTRWAAEFGARGWSPVTNQKLASNLLGAAHEAGFLDGKRDPRRILLPAAGDLALGYLLYLLRSVEFAGTLARNDYLAGVGVRAGDFVGRCGGAAGVRVLGNGSVHSVEWAYADLSAWAAARLELRRVKASKKRGEKQKLEPDEQLLLEP